MQVSAEALGARSGERLIAAGADEVLMPCVGELGDAIDRAAAVPGPVTVHTPANRVTDADALADDLLTRDLASALVVSGNPGHGAGGQSLYQLIPSLRARGIRVSVGAYPEDYFTVTSRGHRQKSAAILADKQAAGAERIITQASFSVDNMRKWLQAIRGHGITIPVHVGVMVRVPRRAVRAMLRSARAEVLSHPHIEVANRANLDLFFRMLRSRMPDPAAFVRAVGALPEMGPQNGFHVFAYGTDASSLIHTAHGLGADAEATGWEGAGLSVARTDAQEGVARDP